jgi:hypothetical protein
VGKRSERGADHSPTSSAQVKNEWSYTSTHRVCVHGVVRNSFTFTFTQEHGFVFIVNTSENEESEYPMRNITLYRVIQEERSIFWGVIGHCEKKKFI